VGEVGAGKTSVIRRYCNGIYSDNYKATVGVDFALKQLDVDKNTLVQLQLWDIAGQERFRNMTRSYYKSAEGAFVVMDITSPPSREAVPVWKRDIDEKVSLPDGRHIPVILLANKTDLVATPEDLSELATQHGFVAWFVCSAKTNTNITEAANCLLQHIQANTEKKEAQENKTVEEAPTEKPITLSSTPNRTLRNSVCCFF